MVEQYVHEVDELNELVSARLLNHCLHIFLAPFETNWIMDSQSLIPDPVTIVIISPTGFRRTKDRAEGMSRAGADTA